MISGLRLEVKELRNGVEEVLTRIDVKVGMEEVRRLGKKRGRGDKMELVKLKKWDHMSEVMTDKRAIYESSERTGADLT